MDFSLSPELINLKERTRRFIDEIVIPAEPRIHGDTTEWVDLRGELQDAARAAGLFAPHIPTELGGLGLNWRECAVIFEEAGRSLLGPQALNCAAPDEGNMHMLEKIASPAQKEKYLRPLAEGKIRSCFAMTEPDGAGADPNNLKTRAELRDGKWVINGHKWFISGAIGASFAICMARTPYLDSPLPSGEPSAARASSPPLPLGGGVMRQDASAVQQGVVLAHQGGRGDSGSTMFLVDANNPGFRILRQVPTLDLGWPGGHAEVEFVDCAVGEDAVLGAVGEGFDYAQVRLGPARLTHCMRWLGAARRAMEYAIGYARERESFCAVFAIERGNLPIFGNAARAAYLHGAVYYAVDGLGDKDFSHAGLVTCSLAHVEKVGGVINHEPRGVHFDFGVGDHELDALMVREGRAK